MGKSYGAIAKKLMELGIKAPGGQDKWHPLARAEFRYDNVKIED